MPNTTSANNSTNEQASTIAEIDLAITGMTCASCVARVEKKLNKVPGVLAVVNLATERAHLSITPEARDITADALITVVKNAGYGAQFIRRIDIHDGGTQASAEAVTAEDVLGAAQLAHTKKITDLRKRFIVAAVLTLPIVVISMAPPLQFAGWQWLVAALSCVVSTYGGWPFHRGAFRAARHGSSTMDTLVSLGVLASMGWSLWALFFAGAGKIGYTMHMSGIHRLTSSHSLHLYFESAAMIVTFLLIGRWLEARSRRTASDALYELLELGAKTAFVVSRGGDSSRNTESAPSNVCTAYRNLNLDTLGVEIPANTLQVGDVFRAQPGETIAADGVVVWGESAVDASMLTGESMPVEVSAGSSVVGATINTYGLIYIRATRVGEETTLAHMSRLLTEAQTGKAPVQRLADRISSIFVPAVLVIAAADFLIRVLVLHNTFETALTSAITVLVVACPCALGLATPTALLVGSGAASKRGILIHGPEVLENAHHATVALLDKTGTLTTGRMAVAYVKPLNTPMIHKLKTELFVPADPNVDNPKNAEHAPHLFTENPYLPAFDLTESDTALALAAAAEAGSEHPIARAIVEASQQLSISRLPVSGFHTVPGCGVSAKLELAAASSSNSTKTETPTLCVNNAPTILPSVSESPTLRVGSAQWLTTEGVRIPDAVYNETPITGTTVAVAIGHTVIGTITVADTLRLESREAVRDLKNLGVTPIMISGDSQATAHAIGTELGIDAQGGVLPEGKVATVKQYQKKGEKVVMVGDGVNDAAALAAADVSIAMGEGTDVAKAAADITIMNSDPRLIARALKISARTLKIIKENLAWAFAYNLVALPLAVYGAIAPGLAAAAMASSSVIVVSNSLRLRNA